MKTYARQLLMELVVSLTFWTRAMCLLPIVGWMILQDVKLAEHCFVHQVDLSLHLGMTSVLHVIQIIIVSIGVLKI